MIPEKQTTQGFVTSKQSLQGSITAKQSLQGNTNDGNHMAGSITIGRPLATIKVNEIEGGYKITVTDPSGVQELNIMDGVDGKDGSNATVTAANIKTALNYTPAKQTDVDNLSKEIVDQKEALSDYALKSEIPTIPVESVNGKIGVVVLDAEDVGADPARTAETKVSEHNISTAAHNDIRLLIEGLTTRLNVLANSDDITLDQMAEVVAYIKSNRTLIESITTDKISVADIVNNLTTNVSNKPLSAAQGAVLKGLIDALQTAVSGIKVPTKTSELTNDSGFLTQHQSLADYAKKTELPTKTSQLTNDSGFLTQHQDLSAYAKTSQIPTKVSQLTNDKNYLTEVPSEYVTETELNAKGYLTQHQDLTPYAKNEDLNKHKNDDTVHITQQERTAWNNKSNFSGSYNDLTNKPTIPSTPEQVGADPKGTATTQVGTHNTNTSAHNDIRLLIEGLTSRLNALANSTDEDLDQMAEIVAYIKSNKSLIESITTSKVNVTDIINNLTTNVSNKPLSAAQGVVLKKLIDDLQLAISDVSGTVEITSGNPTKNGTVLTINPDGEEVNVYTAEEVDELLQNVKVKGGTVEVTDEAPVDENTVFTIHPNGEKVALYTVEEVDELLASLTIPDGGNTTLYLLTGEDLYRKMFDTVGNGLNIGDNIIITEYYTNDKEHEFNEGDIWRIVDVNQIQLILSLALYFAPKIHSHNPKDIDTSSISFKELSSTTNLTSLLLEIERTLLSKTSFSGSYNDLRDKPTVPTKISQLTNDSGYLTLKTLPLYNGEVE